jgi:hypothetical protein
VDPQQRFVFNGVDATTGDYLLPPLDAEEVSRLARGQHLDGEHLDELRWRHSRATEATFGLAEGSDPRDLAQAGWGVVGAFDLDDGILDALRPLLDHRRQQATARHEGRYRELVRELGYRPGETKTQFLARHGVGPGPVDPDRMPYYLMIVGEPDAIPYVFQYQLDVQFAVGRICFDSLEGYARYAEGLVAAESAREPPRANDAVFFAPVNAGDRATGLSATELVAPLGDRMATDHPDWSVTTIVGDAARKSALLDLVGGSRTPALLFTASHGAGFPPGHPAQRAHQGGLVCQDWEGPGTPLGEDAYLTADDVPSEASLAGSIIFNFACFGAGTPAHDGFGHRDGTVVRPLAPTPFVAALPQRLLSHDRGGAFAVAGHVDRAWGYSFVWPGAGRQTEVFRSCLERLLTGHPIGSAFEYLNDRYAELASDLAVALEDVSYGKRPDHQALATMWTANNDARGFAVLGDPAVRLATTVTRTPPSGRDVLRVPTPDARPRPAPDADVRTRPTTDPPGVVPSASRSTDEELDFGLREGLQRTGDRLVDVVQRLADTLADVMERGAESVAVIEVATYTSHDPAAASYDRATGRFEGARLRALSRASIGGDVQLVVDDAEALDEQVWSCHAAMVEQAQRTRTELVRSAGTVVAGLWDALRPGG